MAELRVDYDDDEDLELELALAEAEAEKLQLQAQAQQPAPVEQAAPVQPKEPAYPIAKEPTLLDRAAHVAGGAVKTGFGMMNLPSTLQGLAQSGLDYVSPTPVPETPEEKANLAMAQQMGALTTPSSIPGTKDLPYGAEIEKFLTDPFTNYEDSPVTDTLRTGAEWIPGAGRKLIDKGAKIAPDILSAIGAMIGKNVDEYVNEDGTPKSSWWELITGLAGNFAGMFHGRAPKDLSVSEKNAVDYVKEQTGDLPTPMEVDAAKVAKNKLWEDPSTVVPELSNEIQDAQKMIADKLRQGEKGTLGDLSEATGIQQLEASVDPMGKTGKLLKQAEDARQVQTAQQIAEPFGTANADDAAKLVKRQLTKTRSQADKVAGGQVAAKGQQTSKELAESVAIEQRALSEADVAARQADEVEALVKTDVLPSKASMRFAEGYNTIDKWTDRKLVKPAWRVFENGPPVEITELQAAIKNVIEDLPKTEADFVVDKYGKLLDKIEDMDAVTDPKNLQAVLTKIKSTLNEAKVTGSTGAEEINLAKLSRGMDEFLRSPFGAKGFKEAVDTTKKVKRRIGADTKLAKARLREDTETFVKRLGMTKEDGAALNRIVNRTESAAQKKRLEDVIRSKASDAGIDQNFIDQHKEILSEFPKLKEELTSVVQAKGAATDLGKTAKEATVAETGKRSVLQKSLADKTDEIQKRASGLKNTMSKQILTEFSEHPDTVVNKVLANKYNNRQLRELVANLKLSGADEAFKKSVGDNLLKKLMPKQDRTPTVMRTTLDEFDKIRPTLVDLKIITNKQADEVVEAIQRGKSVLRKTRGRQEIPEMIGDKNFEASLATAAVLKPMKKANSLIMANTIRRKLKKMLENRAKDPDFKKYVEKFLTNPGEYLEAVGRVTNAEQAAKAGEKIVDNMVAKYKLVDTVASDNEEN